VATYEAALERFDWGGALAATWQLVGGINNYLQEKAPWTLAKSGNAEAVAEVIYNALEAVRIAAVLVSPAMPSVAEEIARQLGIADLTPEGAFANVTAWGGLEPGTQAAAPSPIFPRIDTKASAATATPAPPKEKPTVTESVPPAGDTITIDDFARVQLRVADILSAERIEGAKKLLRLRIRVGEGDERQLVAGIAETYVPEDLPGRQIVVVANLQPATIRGVQSQGMLLAATDAAGAAILLTPEKPVAAGSKVK
jgi:methionyl-tRNA synthetase